MKSIPRYADLERAAIEDLAVQTLANAGAPQEHVDAARERMMSARSDNVKAMLSGWTPAMLQRLDRALIAFRDVLGVERPLPLASPGGDDSRSSDSDDTTAT